jgi:RNA polymerase sigma-70 factor (ECF subfamily)
MAPSPVQAPQLRFESIYGALHAQARHYLRREQNAHSMSPTVLVHEAWLSLARSKELHIHDTNHYLRLVGRVMKNLLVDHARRKNAILRGGGLRRVEWSDAAPVSREERDLMLAVAASLKQLAIASPRLAAVVELRYLSGLTEREVAQTLGVSARTVRREWGVARQRLIQSLQSAGALGRSTNG